jgi:hypothetical protein
LIILTIFGKKYKYWSSSLSNFLQPPITLFLLGPICSSVPFSQTLSVYRVFLPTIWETKFHTHIKLAYQCFG